MSLNDLTKEELMTFSYTDLTNKLLKESKKPMTTPAIFKRICELLDYTDAEYEEKIGDYYTSLTLDKRFVLMENHEWDLRERHAVKVEIEEDEEEIVDEDVEEVEDEEEEENIDEEATDELDDSDDDLDDLSIVGDEEEEL